MALPTGFTAPSIGDLIDRISDDLDARLPGEESRIRGSILWVLARVMAGVAYPLYLLLQWVARQVLPDTSETAQLERWAAIYGLTRTAATQASGTTRFTGVNGTVIPGGTIVVRADGERYSTLAAGLIAAGIDDVSIFAVEAGDAGDQVGSVALNLESPIAGIDTATNTQGDLTGGTDTETDASLLERVLQRIREPPQGGAVADYVLWAQSALSTVDRVWVYPLEPTIGAVTVRFSIDWDGVTPSSVEPLPGDVTAVQVAIDARKPVTADAIVAAVTGRDIIMSIGMVDNSAANQAAVNAELDAMFQREARPSGTGAASTLRNGVIQAAIARAVEQYSLTSLDGVAGGDADIAIGVDELLYRGVVTYAVLP